MFEQIKTYFIGEKLRTLDEHHDRVRATTNFYFSLVLLIGFTVALVPAIFSDYADILAIPVFSGSIFSVGLLFANKYIYSSKVIGLIFIVFGLSIAFANMFLNGEVLHIAGPLWILVVLLYSFYNIGVRWSVVVAIISILTYVFWVVYYLPEEVSRVAGKITEMIPVLVLEIGIVFTMLVALILVYMNAIYSKERLLQLKNNQMSLKQKAIEDEDKRYVKQVQKSFDNVSSYLEQISKMDITSSYDKLLNDQLLYVSIVAKSLGHQWRPKEVEPGSLLTSLLSVSRSHFENEEKIKFTVDNTIDFVELKHIFPMSIVVVMLIENTYDCGGAENLAINYYFESGEIVLSYRDDCKKQQTLQAKTDAFTNNSGVVLSDVGARLELKSVQRGTHAEIRFPL